MIIPFHTPEEAVAWDRDVAPYLLSTSFHRFFRSTGTAWPSPGVSSAPTIIVYYEGRVAVSLWRHPRGHLERLSNDYFFWLWDSWLLMDPQAPLFTEVGDLRYLPDGRLYRRGHHHPFEYQLSPQAPPPTV